MAINKATTRCRIVTQLKASELINPLPNNCHSLGINQVFRNGRHAERLPYRIGSMKQHRLRQTTGHNHGFTRNAQRFGKFTANQILFRQRSRQSRIKVCTNATRPVTVGAVRIEVRTRSIAQARIRIVVRYGGGYAGK